MQLQMKDQGQDTDEDNGEENTAVLVVVRVT